MIHHASTSRPLPFLSPLTGLLLLRLGWRRPDSGSSSPPSPSSSCSSSLSYSSSPAEDDVSSSSSSSPSLLPNASPALRLLPAAAPLLSDEGPASASSSSPPAFLPLFLAFFFPPFWGSRGGRPARARAPLTCRRRALMNQLATWSFFEHF